MKSFIEPGDPFSQLASLEVVFREKEETTEEALLFLERENVVIAAEGGDSPIIRVQYHPEYMESKHASSKDVDANQLVFSHFVHRSKEHRLRTKLGGV